MKKTKVALPLIAALAVIFLSSCASTSFKSSEPPVPVPVPQSSSFSKIKVGMSEKEVVDLIGQPTDKTEFMNWTAFVPVADFFLPAAQTANFYYKKEGTIVLNTGNGVYNKNFAVARILYDSHATGYPEFN